MHKPRKPRGKNKKKKNEDEGFGPEVGNSFVKFESFAAKTAVSKEEKEDKPATRRSPFVLADIEIAQSTTPGEMVAVYQDDASRDATKDARARYDRMLHLGADFVLDRIYHEVQKYFKKPPFEDPMNHPDLVAEFEMHADKNQSSCARFKKKKIVFRLS